MVGHRYFLNDGPWETTTLTGIYDVELKQISARMYSVAKAYHPAARSLYILMSHTVGRWRSTDIGMAPLR